MNAPLNEDDSDEAVADWFENTYVSALNGGTAWTDEWSCTCNDRCPGCNVETEPSSSIDLSQPLTKEDYLGAARLLAALPGGGPFEVTVEDAKAYAEAILEGGEDRFSPPRWGHVPRLELVQTTLIALPTDTTLPIRRSTERSLTVKYSPDWDLSTIPETEWKSENGRRQRAKAPRVTNIKLKPCAKCGESLNASQRRKPCPKCGYTHPRRAAGYESHSTA